MICKNGHQLTDTTLYIDPSGQRVCRVCRNIAANASYHRNRPKRLAQMKAAYAANPEPQRIAQRRRYAQDPELYKQIASKWARENPELAQKYKRKRVADYRARKLDQFIESVDPAVVYTTHEGVCGICKQSVSQQEFEVDHIIPISKGGDHGYANVQLAHPFCNRSKGAKVFM